MQARERDRSAAEPIDEEAADERHVVDAGRSGQRALVAQVALERLCLLLNPGQSAWGDLLSGDHAVPAQKVQELFQRGRITLMYLHPSSARSQVPCRMLG